MTQYRTLQKKQVGQSTQPYPHRPTRPNIVMTLLETVIGLCCLLYMIVYSTSNRKRNAGPCDM